jgi:hypothetical protein
MARATAPSKRYADSPAEKYGLRAKQPRQGGERPSNNPISLDQGKPHHGHAAPVGSSVTAQAEQNASASSLQRRSQAAQRAGYKRARLARANCAQDLISVLRNRDPILSVMKSVSAGAQKSCYQKSSHE